MSAAAGYARHARMLASGLKAVRRYQTFKFPCPNGRGVVRHSTEHSKASDKASRAGVVCVLHFTQPAFIGRMPVFKSLRPFVHITLLVDMVFCAGIAAPSVSVHSLAYRVVHLERPVLTSVCAYVHVMTKSPKTMVGVRMLVQMMGT